MPRPPTPEPTRSLLDWIEAPSATRGVRAHVDGRWELTPWATVAATARAVAGALADLGVARGAVVGIVDRGGPSFASALFGTMLLGAAAVPLPMPLPFQERSAHSETVREILALASPTAVICGPGASEALTGELAQAGLRTLRLAELAASPSAPVPARPSRDGIALIQLSSGTTGRRHAAAISMCALQANVDAITGWLAIGDRDATASWLPCHHDMGLVGCMLTPAANSSDLWLSQPETFLRDPLTYLECFARPSGATMSAMPAFALDHVVRRVPPEAVAGMDLSRWRALIVGAERTAPATLARFADLLAPAGFDPGAVLPAYGLAEATLAVTGQALGRRWREEPIPGGAGRAVSCGRPLAGAKVVIVDEHGAPLPDRTIGEITVMNASLASSLVGLPEDAPTRLDADRLRTGDAGFVVGDEVVVLGRLDDGVKVRGRFVTAQDVEQALAAGAVAARRLAVAVGVAPGGRPTTLVVLEVADEHAATRARRIARTVAEGTDVVVIRTPRGTIERTANGKLRRTRLWRLLPGVPSADGTLHPSAPTTP